MRGWITPLACMTQSLKDTNVHSSTIFMSFQFEMIEHIFAIKFKRYYVMSSQVSGCLTSHIRTHLWRIHWRSNHYAKKKKNISYRLGTPVNERLYIFRVLRTSHKLSKRFEYYALVSYLSNFFSIVCLGIFYFRMDRYICKIENERSLKHVTLWLEYIDPEGKPTKFR